MTVSHLYPTAFLHLYSAFRLCLGFFGSSTSNCAISFSPCCMCAKSDLGPIAGGGGGDLAPRAVGRDSTPPPPPLPFHTAYLDSGKTANVVFIVVSLPAQPIFDAVTRFLLNFDSRAGTGKCPSSGLCSCAPLRSRGVWMAPRQRCHFAQMKCALCRHVLLAHFCGVAALPGRACLPSCPPGCRVGCG